MNKNDCGKKEVIHVDSNLCFAPPPKGFTYAVPKGEIVPTCNEIGDFTCYKNSDINYTCNHNYKCCNVCTTLSKCEVQLC